jgi:effector-binding domain-containing protein
MTESKKPTMTMIDNPHITSTTAQLTAVIHITVPRAEIQEVVGPGIQELLTTIAAQQIEPAGPWFTHHLRRPTDTFDLEIGIPVTAVVAAAGRVKPSEWPAMKVARTIYHGPYEGLMEAWAEFIGWIEVNGHEPTEQLWERYLVGPQSTPEPNLWRTELSRPLLN